VTVAALALAMAMLVAPGAARPRLDALRGTDRMRRAAGVSGRVAGAIACAGAIALVAPVAATLAAAVVAVTLAARRRRARQRACRAAESAALQGALGVLVGELRVGAHPVVAFEAAADETEGAVGAALRAVAARARLGADVAAGLRSVAGHSAVPGNWERLSVCWSLAQTQGLAIVALVRSAERDIVERERFASQVTAAMAGARATTAILAGLPVLGVGLGQLIGAQPVRFLLGGGVGGWLLLVGATLACAGLWWSDRITERVLR
jgi:tight adherence protein B